jgi:hypothetical protein
MLKLIENTTDGKALFECECGAIKEMIKSNVISGRSKSCGCLRKKPYARKHGHASGGKRTKAYIAWKGLRSRCNNPNNEHADCYIGRGITYCDRWEKFENFLVDMGEPKDKSMSLDRIDNSKGYSKDNCRWASKKVQANNKRNNVLYTFQGKTQGLVTWAKELGISRLALHNRMKRGMSIDEAFSTPLTEVKLYEYEGKLKTLNEWAKEYGISRRTLANRLNQGADMRAALSTKGYLSVNKTKAQKPRELSDV